jgi:hypothetical protein
VLDIAIAKVGLQGPGIVPLVASANPQACLSTWELCYGLPRLKRQSMRGPRDHGLSCSQLGMSCSWVIVIFERFPRALSFPSGSSFYNALQFSSGFFFSDVLDQSHFSG